MKYLNIIKAQEQTPNACVTACVQSILEANERAFKKLKPELRKYKVPKEMGNPQNNPLYFYSDGLIKVLMDKGFRVTVHSSKNNKQEKDPVYRGRFGELSLAKYTRTNFTQKSFLKYIKEHLEDGGYILVWLDNKIYAPKFYEKNKYKQHVIVINGLDTEKNTATIMDPDIYRKPKHIYEIGVETIFKSLWRGDYTRSNERVIGICLPTDVKKNK